MIRTYLNLQQNLVESCDVCVIGSGAGGGVIAKELAEAGLEVVILEEGGYHPTTSFSHDPQRMLPRLYRNAGGSIVLSNVPFMYQEGRCVGGSTVINAGICYRTPDSVLENWRRQHGLQELGPEDMAPYFERVEQHLNVMPVEDSLFSADSRKMKTAAEGMGFSYVRVKRNIHSCQGTNLCILGCPTGAKQSTLVSYVPAALAAGARLYANCRAEQLVAKNDRISEVRAQVIDPGTSVPVCSVRVKAKAVFVCSGAVHTPALLFRSNLCDSRSMVGRNLFLHPNAKMVGIFDDELKSWQGSIQSIQIDEFSERHGITFGSTFLPPGILALSLPYFANDSLKLMEHYNHMSVWGVLVEDTHAGRVHPPRFQQIRRLFTKQPFTQPLITYFLNRLDKRRFLFGMAQLARLFLAAGARRVLLPFKSLPEINHPDQAAHLAEARVPLRDLNVFTVHLMGTCRMGADPRKSVVDSNHRFHGLRNLFIADASVFPSPVRVNPMLTIMALATRAAETFVENGKDWM